MRLRPAQPPVHSLCFLRFEEVVRVTGLEPVRRSTRPSNVPVCQFQHTRIPFIFCSFIYHLQLLYFTILFSKCQVKNKVLKLCIFNKFVQKETSPHFQRRSFEFILILQAFVLSFHLFLFCCILQGLYKENCLKQEDR